MDLGEKGISYGFPMRKTLVPHSGHLPLTAGRPFFSLVISGSLISLLSLHLTQYAVVILIFEKQSHI
tara:strand:- start:901 stop:1101 length:201 start_codon:yes stop_codon:yes gene_type:complete